ncbi:MAG: polysaccharide pyruvyl transferase family protein, partial [Pseudolabrys sp.]
MDFLLYGYFGAGNLGDDLLLSVATAELRAIFPTARFFVGDHGHAVPEIHDCVFTKTETILADQTKPRIVRLALYLAAYSRLFRQCAWFVFAGGTVFHERGTTNVLLLQWLLCLLARLHGVKIAALGVGIADLHSYSGRWLMRRIVGMSRLFLVRDEAALAQCSGTKAGLGDDLVFAWAGT